MPPDSPRLIDLHVDWLLQYAPEGSIYDPTLYGWAAARRPQVKGYRTATRAAIISCYRDAEDWAGQADPWSALDRLIWRIESDFAGRLLKGAGDLARWEADPEGPCWGVIGVEGFDALVRADADLGRLPDLFARGVRLFQPVYTRTSILGGSSAPGDDRGLTDLGRAFLGAVADLAADGVARPMFDLAHMNPRTCAEALDWFEGAGEPQRLLPIYSHGAIRHEGCPKPRAITPENLRRLRALGGVIGLGVSEPFYHSTAELRSGIEAAAATPFRGQPGYEGIAIGTDFLGIGEVTPGLGNASEVASWIGSTFDPGVASALLQGNAARLLAGALGPPDSARGPAGAGQAPGGPDPQRDRKAERGAGPHDEGDAGPRGDLAGP